MTAVRRNPGNWSTRPPGRTVDAQLFGTGVGPIFDSSLTPGSALDFGNLRPGSSETLSLSILTDQGMPLGVAGETFTFDLAGSFSDLNVDGNGVTDALTDGVLIMRYLSGFRGQQLVQDALAPDATRTDPTKIVEFLDLCQTTISTSTPTAAATLRPTAFWPCDTCSASPARNWWKTPWRRMPSARTPRKS